MDIINLALKISNDYIGKQLISTNILKKSAAWIFYITPAYQ